MGQIMSDEIIELTKVAGSNNGRPGNGNPPSTASDINPTIDK